MIVQTKTLGDVRTCAIRDSAALCLPATPRLCGFGHTGPPMTALPDLASVLPLARGVYQTVCNLTPLWIAVMSNGHYWIVLDEGLRDPLLPFRMAIALDREDPPLTVSSDGKAERRGSRRPRVLPFPPRSVAGPRSRVPSPRPGRAEA
jgi:hypothetical protein